MESLNFPPGLAYYMHCTVNVIYANDLTDMWAISQPLCTGLSTLRWVVTESCKDPSGSTQVIPQ